MFWHKGHPRSVLDMASVLAFMVFVSGAQGTASFVLLYYDRSSILFSTTIRCRTVCTVVQSSITIMIQSSLWFVLAGRLPFIYSALDFSRDKSAEQSKRINSDCLARFEKQNQKFP